jgi:hypothetical protein
MFTHLSKELGSPFARRLAFITLLTALLLSGCSSPQTTETSIRIDLFADGQTKQISLQAGSTVDQALKAAGIELGNLDRTEPQSDTILNNGDRVQVIRVREAFDTQQVAIPFERQTVRNESLPQGEMRLIQPGRNGLQELTYRHVYEDSVEISSTVVKTVVLQAPVPEIEMIGVQSAFVPLPIPGKIAYLAGGNAWLMETSTADRRPLVTSGDLDGYIFELSPNGDWLLFSRKSKQEPDKEINTLWVVNTASGSKPQSLGVSNVVLFAAFDPNVTTTIIYSTVEPRSQVPGWQANNDLYELQFGNGWAGTPGQIVEANSGGVYGWWGTNYAWSPKGDLAYARPDSVGLVNLTKGSLEPLLKITPLQTHSDWAWIPGLAWSTDSQTLLTVTHAPPASLINPEESPYFDLSAIALENSASIDLVKQAGMFAHPVVSPPPSKGDNYKISFLQAIFPAQSDTSRYRLVVMDQDGSNRRVLFPPEDSQGLEPQTPVWAPGTLRGQAGAFLAIIYQGNLWLVDSGNGLTYQITGDGLMNRIAWK